jgi:hypothetical protein
MRATIDLDSRGFIVGVNLTQRVTALEFTRRDTVPVELQFVRAGAVVELATGATGRMGIKATYAGSFLAYDGAWTKTGTGTSTVYTFSLNLNTTELNALFADDTVDSVAAKVEVEWTESGNTSSTLPTSATIYNDVIRGDEGTPTPATSAAYVRIAATPGGAVWRLYLDDNGVPYTVAE